ncbi:hypothetical protein Golax_019949, partial [Gossypium laxum]|nr:hypothetical protein [Gossypium laxum]
MAIYVNLDKPLISQVLINDTLQRVEFESLLVLRERIGEILGKTILPTKKVDFRLVGTRFDTLFSANKNATIYDDEDGIILGLKQPNTWGHGMGFEPFEKGDSTSNGLILVQLEQRASAFKIQPNGILDLNSDSNM